MERKGGIMKLDKSKIDPISKMIYRNQLDNMIKQLAFQMHLPAGELKAMMCLTKDFIKIHDSCTCYVKELGSYKCTAFPSWDIYYKESYKDMGEKLIDSHMFYFDFIDKRDKQRYHIQGSLNYWL